MRLWEVGFRGDDVAAALVLAPSADEAWDAATRHTEAFLSPMQVTSARELRPTAEVLVLDLDLDGVEQRPVETADGPRLWKVPHNDGLFHRSPGASLVVADAAIEALRLVIEADPFEGQPPYGVPPAYGPVARFVPAAPMVLWRELRSD